MLEAGPITAKYLIETVHCRYGLCKYCGSGYHVNKNGLLFKHKGCKQDYPVATFISNPDGYFYARLDELAEIAMMI